MNIKPLFPPPAEIFQHRVSQIYFKKKRRDAKKRKGAKVFRFSLRISVPSVKPAARRLILFVRRKQLAFAFESGKITGSVAHMVELADTLL
jgi:hypothetical protein